MTTANKITILRILLIPFFVVEVLYYGKSGNEVHRLAALLTFFVAAVCDGVDGYIARHYNQRSELGAILDPLADKLLLVSGIVLLSFDHGALLKQIPLWLMVSIIGRDILVLIGLGLVYITLHKVRVRPRVLGKISTVLQMVVVLWILLRWDVAFGERWIDVLMVGTAVSTVASGLLYILDGVRQLGTSPSSSATGRAPSDVGGKF